MSAIDNSRSILIDALNRRDGVKEFDYSNLILPNGRSVKAIGMLRKMKNDLLAFAEDPTINIVVPPLPSPPILEGLPPADQLARKREYEKILLHWEILRLCALHRVSPNDYYKIVAYLEEFELMLYGMCSVKGQRFYSFTKRTDEPPKQGFLSGLLHRGGDKE